MLKRADMLLILTDIAKIRHAFCFGKGEHAEQNMIQVANMGEIYEQDCYNMLEIFEIVLYKMKHNLI